MLGLGEGPVVVGIGQLVPWKNHELFLDAAAIVHRARPEVRFAIAGSEELADGRVRRSALEARIARNGLQGAVEFLGFRSDIPDLLAAADLLVHAAHPEPFGRVIVEAMASGKPVVAVRGGHGPAEILRDGIDGWLVAPQAPALADAVLRSLQVSGENGEGARKRAQKLFDRKVMARRVMDVYLELLANGRRPSGP